MPNAKNKRGYSARDLRDVRDNPEWTAEDFARAKPFAEVFPELAASIRRGRGPNKAPTKKLVAAAVGAGDRGLQGRRPRLAIADRRGLAADQENQVTTACRPHQRHQASKRPTATAASIRTPPAANPMPI
jgi:uncharacterized protein (DUF4415 family)